VNRLQIIRSSISIGLASFLPAKQAPVSKRRSSIVSSSMRGRCFLNTFTLRLCALCCMNRTKEPLPVLQGRRLTGAVLALADTLRRLRIVESTLQSVESNSIVAKNLPSLIFSVTPQPKGNFEKRRVDRGYERTPKGVNSAKYV
jgi:hypothetical protein